MSYYDMEDPNTCFYEKLNFFISSDFLTNLSFSFYSPSSHTLGQHSYCALYEPFRVTYYVSPIKESVFIEAESLKG